MAIRGFEMRKVIAPRSLRAASVAIMMASALAACGTSQPSASSKSGHVLLVGNFHGKQGQYQSIQAAVDAAKRGDWILVAPGDYHETADLQAKSLKHADMGGYAGVMIQTPGLHLRGMDRSGVIVDGTKASASEPCSSAPADQQFGAKGSDGKALGRNGVVAWMANEVSIENLTVCNFLSGSGESGNEVWWNGGATSGKIGLTGYHGAYLTTTSSYYGGDGVAATYGVFSSNAQGPATWSNVYGSNFNDSGMYVGACMRLCGITIDHAWMEYSALGYSGTNSGGAIVIKNSEFDNNQDGFDTNTQIAGDPPAPQDGRCPGNGTSPITHTHSCWVFMNNYVHDNNNNNTPRAGNAAAGPLGTGMTVAGGRNDTIMNNRFENNNSWGFLFVPFPDSDTPPKGVTCEGTGGKNVDGLGCIFDPQGNALINNHFKNNGSFGNPSNGDIGQVIFNAGQRSNCFSNNHTTKEAPANLEATFPQCGKLLNAANTGGDLLGQVLCDSGFGDCPAGSKYPAYASTPTMHPLPKHLASMPNPCKGVPDNAWCKAGKVIA